MNSRERKAKDEREFAHRFLPEFAKETDRGCVLIVAVMAEGLLEKMLKKKLVQISTSEDPLFDVPYAPLRSLSTKIDFAYRLGLINKKLCRNLHILRKIRNLFSHHIFDCDFNDEAVKSQLSEMISSIPSFAPFLRDEFSKVAGINKEWAIALKGKKERADLLICATALIINLQSAEQDVEEPIKPEQSRQLYS